MNKNFILFALSILYVTTSMFMHNLFTFSSHHLDDTTQEVTVAITLDPDEWLYKDSLTLSVDNPAYQVSEIKYSKDALNRYDHAFQKKQKKYLNMMLLFLLK